MRGIRLTCIHIRLHVYIITKVWNYKRGEWYVHKGSHMFAHNYEKE